jgi:hypothetical protein
VYHAGEKSVVEAEIVLASTTSLDIACKLKSELKKKIEGLEEI